MDYETKMHMIKQWFADFHSFAENYGDNYYDPHNDNDDKIDITSFDVLYEQINDSVAHDTDPKYFKYGSFIRDMYREDNEYGEASIIDIIDDDVIVVMDLDDIVRIMDASATKLMPHWTNVYYVKHRAD